MKKIVFMENGFNAYACIYMKRHLHKMIFDFKIPKSQLSLSLSLKLFNGPEKRKRFSESTDSQYVRASTKMAIGFRRTALTRWNEGPLGQWAT